MNTKEMLERVRTGKLESNIDDCTGGQLISR